MTAEPWIPVAEAADRLGVSRQAVHRLVGRGRLRAEWVRPRYSRPTLHVHSADVASWHAFQNPEWRPAGHLLVDEVAERYDRQPDTVKDWCKDGVLPYIVQHGRRWIPETALTTFTPPVQGRPRKDA